MKRIIVTGAGGPAASNFIASLRLAPEPFYIVGTDTQPYRLELADVEARYLLPPATDDLYIPKLNELIARERIDLVHPQPDIEVDVLSRQRERVKARLCLPATNTVELCQDKFALIARLNASDIPQPQSYLISEPDDLRRSLEALLPRCQKVWLRAIRGAQSRAALPISEFEHGFTWIEYWSKTKGVGWGDFMASEYLPGAEFAFQSVWRNGELITSQARERLEYLFGQHTVSGQTSSPSIARAVHRDDVNDIATRAITGADPQATGIFCVDMKENVDGVPCVTEINVGRFFTTSNFFAEAGANMPYSYIKMAFGEDLPVLPRYNAVEENWYWVRNIDMGFKLVKDGTWTSERV